MSTEIIRIDDHQDSLPAATQSKIMALVEEFLGEQDIRAISKKKYRNSLKYYFRWVESTKVNLQTATKADIINYKNHLKDERKSVQTVGSYLVALRQFYSWLESKRYAPNIVAGIKGDTPENKFVKQHLTEDESHRLLEYFKARSIRDYALVNLLLRTGIRTIEASRARMGDIQSFKGRWQMFIHGKGRNDKKEYVWLEEKAWIPIRDYFAERPHAIDKDPVFATESSNAKWTKENTVGNVGGISTKTISTMIRDGLDAIGLTSKAQYTAHSLRHTFAVLLIKHGARLEDVQAALRHKNIATTQIYLQSIAEDERFEKRIEALINNAF